MALKACGDCKRNFSKMGCAGCSKYANANLEVENSNKPDVVLTKSRRHEGLECCKDCEKGINQFNEMLCASCNKYNIAARENANRKPTFKMESIATTGRDILETIVANNQHVELDKGPINTYVQSDRFDVGYELDMNYRGELVCVIKYFDHKVLAWGELRHVIDSLTASIFKGKLVKDIIFVSVIKKAVVDALTDKGYILISEDDPTQQLCAVTVDLDNPKVEKDYGSYHLHYTVWDNS